MVCQHKPFMDFLKLRHIAPIAGAHLVSRMQLEGTTMIKNGQSVSTDRTAIYHALVDILPEAVCVIDMNQRIILVNNKAASFIGEHNETCVIGRSVLDYIAPEHHQNVKNSIRKNLERGFGRTTEYSLLRKDGSRLPVEVTTSFVTDDNDIPIAIVCLVRNISEAKKTKEIHAATAKRATLLADLMGHDISNQLQIMLSSTELLLVHVKDQQATGLLKILMASIQRCQWIIESSEDIERLGGAS